jgi:hypothetical protein
VRRDPMFPRERPVATSDVAPARDELVDRD